MERNLLGEVVMQHVSTERITWTQALAKETPLLLPVAHDALTARVLERAGFTALQIGGFAVEGSQEIEKRYDAGRDA